MKRLYNVLELRLASDGGREYLAGPGKGQYTTADFAIWPSAYVPSPPLELFFVELGDGAELCT